MIGVEGVLLEDPTGLAAEYAKQALEEEPEKKDNHSLLNEARGEDYHVPVYEGWIAHAAGDYVQADRIWDEMVERYPQVWFAWSVRADAYVKQARYDEAIACYRRAIACQTPPRFTDNEDSIAQICMIRGDTDGAIEAYENVVRIMEEDWGITEGETVEGYRQNIAQLRAQRKP